MATVTTYINRRTNEKVKAMYYSNIDDFESLYTFIGDIMPTITNAHTRVYEQNWVVRHNDDTVEFINCAHHENCFEKKYAIFK